MVFQYFSLNFMLCAVQVLCKLVWINSRLKLLHTKYTVIDNKSKMSYEMNKSMITYSWLGGLNGKPIGRTITILYLSTFL